MSAERTSAVVLLALMIAACRGGKSAPSADGATADANVVVDGGGPIAATGLASHDPSLRRPAARALALDMNAEASDQLLTLLADDDDEVVAWAAFGLGAICRGHDDVHVRALAARAVALREGATRASRRIDVRSALARAVARCGGVFAEPALTSWARAGAAWVEPALLALGDLAGRRGALSDEALTVILGLASARAPLALYPMSRIESVPEPFGDRVAQAARALLAVPGEERIFAVRTLARSGRGALADLADVVSSPRYSIAERVDASRALERFGEAGRETAARTLVLLGAPGRAAITGGEHGLWLELVAVVAHDVPRVAEQPLFVLANLPPPSGASPSELRRRELLRCAAAGALARGSFDAPVLRQCGPEDGEISALARLDALLRRPLVGARRGAFITFARGPRVTVRSRAIDAIGQHRELGDLGRALLAEALDASDGRIVEAAANVVHAHPERVLVPTAEERRAALDPRAASPSRTPAQQVDARIERALGAALARPWLATDGSLRLALLDAALATQHKGAAAAAMAACADASPSIRARVRAALREIDGGAPSCPKADTSTDRLAPPAAPSARAVVFDTECGSMSVHFDTELAPAAVDRFIALARAGAHRGMAFDRVVPGAVVELGAQAPAPLAPIRSELAPVAVERFDVGVVAGGHERGPLSIFVALSRAPQLDGERVRLGHAQGPWESVAPGDRILDERVE